MFPIAVPGPDTAWPSGSLDCSSLAKLHCASLGEKSPGGILPKPALGSALAADYEVNMRHWTSAREIVAYLVHYFASGLYFIKFPRHSVHLSDEFQENKSSRLACIVKMTVRTVHL